MTGGNDLQMQPTTQDGRLWKTACEAAEQRAEAAEARATRFADLNERTINETHAGWMAARAEAERWESAVKAMLTIAGLSPALSAAEAVDAVREELARRALAQMAAAPTRDRLAEIIGSFPLFTSTTEPGWLRVIGDAFEGGPEKRAEAIYQLVDDVLAEFSAASAGPCNVNPKGGDLHESREPGSSLRQRRGENIAPAGAERSAPAEAGADLVEELIEAQRQFSRALRLGSDDVEEAGKRRNKARVALLRRLGSRPANGGQLMPDPTILEGTVRKGGLMGEPTNNARPAPPPAFRASNSGADPVFAFRDSLQAEVVGSDPATLRTYVTDALTQGEKRFGDLKSEWWRGHIGAMQEVLGWLNRFGSDATDVRPIAFRDGMLRASRIVDRHCGQWGGGGAFRTLLEAARKAIVIEAGTVIRNGKPPFSTYPEQRAELLRLACYLQEPGHDAEDREKAADELSDHVRAILEDEAMAS